MPKENYFSRYKSPNIVIIPVCYPPSPKRLKAEDEMQSLSPQHDDLSFLDDFNIDEIVECLNNCDNNDNTTIQEKTSDVNTTIQEKTSDVNTTIQEKTSDVNTTIQEKTSDVNNTPEELVENKENKVNESQSNNTDYDEKSETIELEAITKAHVTLKSEENEIQNKIVTNILDTDNNNSDRISETNVLRSNECNIQLNLSTAEDTVKKAVCTEAKVIEKDSEQDSIDKIKHLDNVNKSEHIEINKRECQDNNELLNNKPIITKINNTNESQGNNIDLPFKDTTKILNPDATPTQQNVINEGKGHIKENTSNISAISIKSVVSKNDNRLCQNLEKRMCHHLQKKYTVESVLHYGKFSKIFKCSDSFGKEYAVKMLNNKFDTYFFENSIDNMLMNMQAEIPKENLFLVYCSNSFSFFGYWCFLIDYYPINLKQALEESLKPFHIDLVREFAKQLVAAVTLLRNNNVVHSDINPGHILLNSSKNCLKLCGFDRTYHIKDAIIKPNIGTLNYRPPEVILGYSAGFSIDVWGTALVLYKMITGKELFSGFTNLDILYKQISTIGDIPPDMLQCSHYSSQYFLNGIFRKRHHYKEKAVFTNHYNNYNTLHKTVYASYNNNWESSRTKIQKQSDLRKSKLLLNLLQQMLTIHPKYRITIEFVYANPFIHEM